MADNVYNLKFTLSNGDVIDAGQITAPQGPKGDKGDSADIPYSSSTPFMDGVGSVGSASTVARGDHRHPSDTSRQEKLVSGTNIKTINGQSVLGSGDIPISGGGTIDADTLNGLLSGSNGIEIAKNTTGDKVEVGISRSGFDLGNPGADGKGTEFKHGDAFEQIYLSSPLGNTITIYNETGGKDNYIKLNNNVSYMKVSQNDVTYSQDGQIVKHYLREDNTKTINGESIYGIGNIDAVPYMTDTYTIPTTDTPIAELIPAGYNKYELEIFADTITKFKVFLDGHEAFSNAIYLKLVQTGASLNAFFVAETGNGIHTNNIGGQIKDRVTIQGIDSGSPVVYICKKLN